MDKRVAVIPMVFGGLLAAAGAFFFRLGWLTRGFDRQIAAEGTDTQAEVTDHRSLKAARGGARTYYITTSYAAPVAGGPPQRFTQDSPVSAADYERLNPGDTVTVRYLPNAPKEMMLSGGVRDQTGPGFFRLGVILLVLGVGLLLIGVGVLLR
jgi:hypothetical protein